MAEWATFTGVVGVVLVLLLLLARASATVLTDSTSATNDSTDTADRPTRTAADETPVGPDKTAINPDETVSDSADDPSPTTHESSPTTDRRPPTVEETPPATAEAGQFQEPDHRLDSADVDGPLGDTETRFKQPDGQDSRELPPLSTPALLANVALSQGLFAVLLIVMAWYTEIPSWAFGLSAEQFTLGGVGTGIAVGGVFYGLNEAAAAVGRRQGMATPTELREALAPETAAGWAVLLLIVLPIIAGFEELLFRGALIGVVHAGFGVSPWLLSIGSSVAFGLGHGAQGRLGIVVTGLLGIGLAAVFIVTGSLLVVVVAHYVINATEFVIHEGLEL